jgi:hypothetical protein
MDVKMKTRRHRNRRRSFPQYIYIYHNIPHAPWPEGSRKESRMLRPEVPLLRRRAAARLIAAKTAGALLILTGRAERSPLPLLPPLRRDAIGGQAGSPCPGGMPHLCERLAEVAGLLATLDTGPAQVLLAPKGNGPQRHRQYRHQQRSQGQY